jgi:hypothetical protein
MFIAGNGDVYDDEEIYDEHFLQTLEDDYDQDWENRYLTTPVPLVGEIQTWEKRLKWD